MEKNMKVEMSKADVESEFSNVIVLYSYQTEVVNSIKKAFSPVGYNAGVYGWNYDVYDINGVGFVEGYRIPNFKNSSRYSEEILDKVTDKINEVWKNNRKQENLTSYNYKKEQIEFLEAFKEFTDSVKQGIHEPSIVKSFASYKREFLDQKNQHPDEDLFLVAQRLAKYIAPESKEKIQESLKKKMSKHSSLPTYKQQLQGALADIVAESLKEKNQSKKNPERKSESYER